MVQLCSLLCTRSITNRLCTVFTFSPMCGFLSETWNWRDFKPCVILPGSAGNAERKQWDKRVFVRCNNKSTCMDRVVWKDFSETLGRIIRLSGHRILILLDECSTHFVHSDINNQQRQDGIFIQSGIANCTHFWQAWDQINGIFKNMVQDKINLESDKQIEVVMQRCFDNDEELTQEEIDEIKKEETIDLKKLRILLTKWVGETWEIFCIKYKHLMVKSWWNSGLTLPFDRSQDEEFKKQMINTYGMKNSEEHDDDFSERIAEAQWLLSRPTPRNSPAPSMSETVNNDVDVNEIDFDAENDELENGKLEMDEDDINIDNKDFDDHKLTDNNSQDEDQEIATEMDEDALDDDMYDDNEYIINGQVSEKRIWITLSNWHQQLHLERKHFVFGRIRNRIRNIGGTRLERVAGDGNCLTNAFSEHINGEYTRKLSRKERKDIVKYTVKNRHEFQGIINPKQYKKNGEFLFSAHVAAWHKLRGINVAVYEYKMEFDDFDRVYFWKDEYAGKKNVGYYLLNFLLVIMIILK
eukprot:475235_1